MGKNKYLKIASCASALAVLFGLNILPAAVFGQASSPNYKVEEVYFGTGGELDASSANYRSQQSSGSLVGGTASSSNYDVNGGFLTPGDPFLQMVVENATVSFGTLDSGSTSYGAAQAGDCNCSFYVKSYLSSEYAVYTISDPPTSENGDDLDAKAAQGAPGGGDAVEEFGINLVANTVPGTFGANRVNQPDDTFADGEAAAGYDTTNQYKYGVGDIIARSQATPGNQAVGLTEYTISYIAKPSINTPAGFYQMDHVLVVVATF